MRGWHKDSWKHSLAAKGIKTKVDLKKYSGTWRQESVSPTPWFQKGCDDVTATYRLRPDGKVDVINKCGDREVKGVAESVSDDNRTLSVDFGFPFPKGKYEIESLNKDYTRAVVKGGKYKWVLRRDSLSANVDVEKYQRWRRLVNMSPSELKDFMAEYGDEAGLSRAEASEQGIKSGRDSARAIIRMKEKGKENWNDNDVEWMNRQISFVSRMKGAKGPLYDERGRPTRKLLALKVWGHDPSK